MTHFQNLKTEAEIKAEYRKLALKNHPDLGGSLEMMKEINAEYKEALTTIYQGEGKSLTEIDDLLNDDEGLRMAVYETIDLQGITAEICGNWLWITGDTMKHKEKFKSLGMKWARKKKAWYYRNARWQSKNRKQMGMNEIRYRHGSIALNPDMKKQNRQLNYSA